MGDDEAARADADTLTLEDIKEQVRHIEKAVQTKETRFMTRTVRSLVPLRRRLNEAVLLRLAQAYFPGVSPSKDAFLAFLSAASSGSGETARALRPPAACSQRRKCFFTYCCCYTCSTRIARLRPLAVSQLLWQRTGQFNRRTLDMLTARAYFYYARSHELAGQLSTVRPQMLQRLRTCTLRQDWHGCATLTNCLLRSYLMDRLLDQAARLVDKCAFPELAPNHELARYHFYLGRIRAAQLQYSRAAQHLQQALRKAASGQRALGFRQICTKLQVVVQLLIGETPDRQAFREQGLRRPLAPYLRLTQAVRSGRLAEFNTVLRDNAARFKADNTWLLCVRLRHNVIKVGVRQVALSYSRISLAAVASKLQLDSAEEAEYVAAKAIRDGVIEATIDHKAGTLSSRETADLYGTAEPADQFQQRINFCL
uniref:PCI domain-containing protein n=1 Tax=Macrostomum lignano TaxID=282301 RepID=A0A1I8JES4_9PLAT